jgi:hypothetical protein
LKNHEALSSNEMNIPGSASPAQAERRRQAVTKDQSSALPRHDIRRDCRDVFLSLVKTCAKLKIPFWDYLADRLAVPGAPAIPSLPELVLARSRSP